MGFGEYQPLVWHVSRLPKFDWVCFQGVYGITCSVLMHLGSMCRRGCELGRLQAMVGGEDGIVKGATRYTRRFGGGGG